MTMITAITFSETVKKNIKESNMEFRCTCHNSGTNSFTGKCSNCGMTKPSSGTIITNNSTIEQYKTIHENDARLFPKVETRTSIIAEFKNKILQLDKYYPEPDNEWASMSEDKDGEWVKLEDILNLF